MKCLLVSFVHFPTGVLIFHVQMQQLFLSWGRQPLPYVPQNIDYVLNLSAAFLIK